MALETDVARHDLTRLRRLVTDRVDHELRSKGMTRTRDKSKSCCRGFSDGAAARCTCDDCIAERLERQRRFLLTMAEKLRDFYGYADAVSHNMRLHVNEIRGNDAGVKHVQDLLAKAGFLPTLVADLTRHIQKEADFIQDRLVEFRHD